MTRNVSFLDEADILRLQKVRSPLRPRCLLPRWYRTPRHGRFRIGMTRVSRSGNAQRRRS